MTEETSTHGDFTSFPNNGGAPLYVLLPSADPASKQFLARASAGFNSEAEKSIHVTAAFTVPPDVQQVEIEVAGTYRIRTYESATICVWLPFPVPSGFGTALSGVMVNAERINTDGTTVVADGFHDDAMPSLPIPQCGLPVPDPPPLIPSWPLVLRFAPAAQGGNYQLVIYLRAHATTMGAASADALAVVQLEQATIRFRR